MNKKSTMTLDGKHNEKMKHFKNIKEKLIPELTAKKNHFKKILSKSSMHISK